MKYIIDIGNQLLTLFSNIIQNNSKIEAFKLCLENSEKFNGRLSQLANKVFLNFIKKIYKRNI